MSILGPYDRRPEVQLWGSTIRHLKEYRTEYKDEYSEPQVHPEVPAVRSQMAEITSRMGTLPQQHSTMHNATTRLPPGHPPAATYRQAGAPPVGTMTRGTGTINTLKDSTLYQQEQTWAHWRVAVDSKPADTRRKYRGQG